MVGIFFLTAPSSRGQDVVEDVGRLFERLDDVAHMRPHEGVGIGLLLQRHSVQEQIELLLPKQEQEQRSTMEQTM